MFNPTFDHATGIRGRQICTRMQSLYTHGVVFVPTEQTAGCKSGRKISNRSRRFPGFCLVFLYASQFVFVDGHDAHA